LFSLQEKYRELFGTLLEDDFERYGVRYIAIMDNIDSEQGLSDLVPMADLFNEWHAKNTSQKVKGVMQSIGNAGLPLTTNPPYGYKKDPGTKHKWIVDEPAAEVVKRIFALCMDGNGPTQIARILEADKIPTPVEYRRKLGHNTSARPPARQFGWSGRIVANILERLEYIGHTVNFRTYRKSFKNKKTLHKDPMEWKIFENTHEPIVEKSVWERVQEIRKNKRRPLRTGKISLFSGLLECADCHSKLYYCTSSHPAENQDHFVCSHYRRNTESCSAHFIRELALYNLVLTHLQRTLSYVKQYESHFVQAINQKSTQTQAKSIAEKRKRLERNGKRIVELDVLFQRIYEDSVANRITEERFLKMSSAYETEQSALNVESVELETELDAEQQTATNTDRFLSIVRRYTEIDDLSPTILNDFIAKIVVHEPDKSSGKRKQKVEIFYNCVGIIATPDEESWVAAILECKRGRKPKEPTTA
jgi:hypothetical protein